MKKNICKIILFAMVFVIVLAIYIYVDSDKHRCMKDSGADGVLKKQENVVANEKKAQNENDTVEGNNEEMELTKEYVCSEFGIDEAEFEGVDFEDFVDYYNLSYDTIHKEAVAYLLKRYKEDYGKVRIPDYRDIFKYVGTATLTKENQNEISIVFFSRIEGEEHFFYIFDFEIGKIIVGSGSEANVCEDDIVGEADGNVKSAIIALFEQYNIYSWRTRKANASTSTNKDIMGTTGSWSLDIKFEDATIYGIHGKGLTDETTPEDLDLFVEDLKALATSSGNQN